MGQLKFRNYIPTLMASIGSFIMCMLMFLPNNQYMMMQSMQNLQTTVDEYGNVTSAEVNWGVTIPGLFTIFILLLLATVFLLGCVGFISNSLFNFRVINLFVLGTLAAETILQVLFLIFALQVENFAQVGNYISTIFNVILFIAFIVAFEKCVNKDYKDIIKAINYKKKKEPEKPKPVYSSKEEEEDARIAALSDETKKQMVKMTLDMLEKGTISKEEAEKMINDINDRN